MALLFGPTAGVLLALELAGLVEFRWRAIPTPDPCGLTVGPAEHALIQQGVRVLGGVLVGASRQPPQVTVFRVLKGHDGVARSRPSRQVEGVLRDAVLALDEGLLPAGKGG